MEYIRDIEGGVIAWYNVYTYYVQNSRSRRHGDIIIWTSHVEYIRDIEGGVIAWYNVYTYSSRKTSTCEVPSNGVVEISLLPVRTGETSI